MDQAINDAIRRLSEKDQRRVLEFARSLPPTSQTTAPIASTADVLRFVGAIPVADLDEMRAAIEQGCEQVDTDEW